MVGFVRVCILVSATTNAKLARDKPMSFLGEMFISIVGRFNAQQHRTIVSHMVEPSLLAWYVIVSAYQGGPNFDLMVLGL